MTRCERGKWAKSLGWHLGRKHGEKTIRNNWMRIGLAIARADYPAATPPLMPNISPFRDFKEIAYWRTTRLHPALRG